MSLSFEEAIWCSSWNRRLWTPGDWPQCHVTVRKFLSHYSTLGKASKHGISCIVIYIQKQKTMMHQYQGGRVSSVLKLRVNFSLLLYDACIFFIVSEQKNYLCLVLHSTFVNHIQHLISQKLKTGCFQEIIPNPNIKWNIWFCFCLNYHKKWTIIKDIYWWVISHLVVIKFVGSPSQHASLELL